MVESAWKTNHLAPAAGLKVMVDNGAAGGHVLVSDLPGATGQSILSLSDAGTLYGTDATVMARLVAGVEQTFKTTWTSVWSLFRSLGGAFSAPVGVGFAALTDAATITTDGGTNKGNIFTVTIAGNRTFSPPTNLPPGAYTYLITQGTGGGFVPTFSGSPVWLGTGGAAPTFSTAAGKTDAVSMLWTGSVAYLAFAKGS